MPIDAAGPVNGAIRPIERVLPHLMSAVPALAGAAALVGDLVDPRAAGATAPPPAATSAATTNFLILPSCRLPGTCLRLQFGSFVCLVRTRSGVAGGMKDSDDLHRPVPRVLQAVLAERRQRA